jgi:hypothetical protein
MDKLIIFAIIIVIIVVILIVLFQKNEEEGDDNSDEGDDNSEEGDEGGEEGDEGDEGDEGGEEGPLKIVMSYDGPIYIVGKNRNPTEDFVSFMKCPLSTGTNPIQLKCGITYKYLQTPQLLTTASLLTNLQVRPIMPFDAASKRAREGWVPDLKFLAGELVETCTNESKSMFISNAMQMLTDVNPTVQLFVQNVNGQIMLELGKLTVMYAYEKSPGLLLTPDILSEELYNTRVPLMWTGKGQNCPAIIAMSLALAIFKDNDWQLRPDLFEWEEKTDMNESDRNESILKLDPYSRDICEADCTLQFDECVKTNIEQQPGANSPQRESWAENQCTNTLDCKKDEYCIYQSYHAVTASNKSLEEVDLDLQNLIAPLLQKMVLYSLRKHFDEFMIRAGRVNFNNGLYEWLARIVDSAETTERQEIYDNSNFSNSVLAQYTGS